MDLRAAWLGPGGELAQTVGLRIRAPQVSSVSSGASPASLTGADCGSASPCLLLRMRR